jgi:hypothetical protein
MGETEDLWTTPEDRIRYLEDALRDLIADCEESDPFPTSDSHPLYAAREVLYGHRHGKLADDGEDEE